MTETVLPASGSGGEAYSYANDLQNPRKHRLPVRNRHPARPSGQGDASPARRGQGPPNTGCSPVESRAPTSRTDGRSASSPLWRLVPLVQRHKGRFWGGMSLINTGRLLEAIMPLYLKMGIDRIAAGDTRLALPALAILGLMVLRYISFNIGRRLVREVGVNAAYELRQRPLLAPRASGAAILLEVHDRRPDGTRHQRHHADPSTDRHGVATSCSCSAFPASSPSSSCSISRRPSRWCSCLLSRSSPSSAG